MCARPCALFGVGECLLQRNSFGEASDASDASAQVWQLFVKRGVASATLAICDRVRTRVGS